MSSLRIKILDPKAKKLLKNLEDLKMISISEPRKSAEDLKSLLSRLRSKSTLIPTLDEIVKEVRDYRKSKNG